MSTPKRPIAYSYLRFSSPEQAKGDSLRRQTELRDAWLARSGAVLDTSLTMKDEGVSAFSGAHRESPDRHALAAFLELVRRKRIARGSYLVLESLDRLSREEIRPALTLLLELIEAGVRIVQLLPVEAVYDDRVEPMALVMAIMELSRGHSESRMKSERVGRAWQEKRKVAAAGGAPMTSVAPAWLRMKDGRFEVIEARAATIRLIYRLTTEGYGVGAITKQLNQKRVPSMGRSNRWSMSYVTRILDSRAVFGEFQPTTGCKGEKRKPVGPPIAGYYPAILTESRWHAARLAISKRRRTGGPMKRSVAVFSGLLRDARDHGPIHQIQKGAKARGTVLVSYKATLGEPGAKYVSFPAATFESALLSKLREINPREVLPSDGDSTLRSAALAGRLATIEGRQAKLKAQLLAGGDFDSGLDILRSLDAEGRAVSEELAEARREEASPLSGAWQEFKSLAAALESAPDEKAARVRLRAAVRRMVTEIWCLFASRGNVRLAAVQVRFAEGKHRDYLIMHRAGRNHGSVNRPAATSVQSLVFPGGPEELDLRQMEHVTSLEAAINAIELQGLV